MEDLSQNSTEGSRVTYAVYPPGVRVQEEAWTDSPTSSPLLSGAQSLISLGSQGVIFGNQLRETRNEENYHHRLCDHHH